MTRRQVIALGSFILGWSLLVLMVIGMLAVNEPEFHDLHSAQSPLPLPPFSEQRIALLLVVATPGAGLCLLGLFLWLSNQRRAREEELRAEAISSWSCESLDCEIETWLGSAPWAPPRESEVVCLADQLQPRERARLARFFEGAGFGHLAVPQLVPDRLPRAMGFLWWSAVIGLWSSAAFVLIWVVAATILIPTMARASGLNPPISPAQARGGLVMGIGIALIPILIGIAMAVTAVSRRRRITRITQRQIEHSRHILETTRHLLSLAQARKALAPIRERLTNGLVAAARPELLPADGFNLERFLETTTAIESPAV